MPNIFMNCVDYATAVHKSPAMSLIYIDVNRKRMVERNMAALSNARTEKWSAQDQRDDERTGGWDSWISSAPWCQHMRLH